MTPRITKVKASQQLLEDTIRRVVREEIKKLKVQMREVPLQNDYSCNIELKLFYDKELIDSDST